MSHSYSTQGDKNLSKLTRLAVASRFDGRNQDSPATVASQGVVTQLSEQISTLNERMDEFTCRMEELNSKLTIWKASSRQLNLSVAAEGCNDTGPTSLFTSGFGNGSTGSLLTNSLSSSQLAKESTLMDEINRGQRQLIHQLDNLRFFMKEWEIKLPTDGQIAEAKAELVTCNPPLVSPLLLQLPSLLLVQESSSLGDSRPQDNNQFSTVSFSSHLTISIHLINFRNRRCLLSRLLPGKCSYICKFCSVKISPLGNFTERRCSFLFARKHF